MSDSKRVYVYDDYKLYEKDMQNKDNSIVRIYDDRHLKYWYSVYRTMYKNDKDFKPFDILVSSSTKNDICVSITKDEFIKEFKKRYAFLQKNYLFLLAPLIREESDLWLSHRKSDYEFRGQEFNSERQIYIGIDKYLFSLIEHFMFFYKNGTDGRIENHPLYKKVRSLQNNKEYLEEVKRGISILEKEKLEKNYLKINLSLFDLFVMIRGFIKGEHNSSKSGKLDILDEYFRVSRYRNDGKSWISGFKLDSCDAKKNLNGSNIDPCGRRCYSVIDLQGSGCFNNPFIAGFRRSERIVGDNYEVVSGFFGKVNRKLVRYDLVYSHLSDEDILELYLRDHDELPWNLKVMCSDDSSFERPKGTKPCFRNLNVREENVFMLGNYFYNMCPNCGYIVNVTDSLVNSKVRERIAMRCGDDIHNSKKNLLFSELISLDSDYKVFVRK